jgi:hypothetical protein
MHSVCPIEFTRNKSGFREFRGIEQLESWFWQTLEFRLISHAFTNCEPAVVRLHKVEKYRIYCACMNSGGGIDRPKPYAADLRPALGA